MRHCSRTQTGLGPGRCRGTNTEPARSEGHPGRGGGTEQGAGEQTRSDSVGRGPESASGCGPDEQDQPDAPGGEERTVPRREPGGNQTGQGGGRGGRQGAERHTLRGDGTGERRDENRRHAEAGDDLARSGDPAASEGPDRDQEGDRGDAEPRGDERSAAPPGQSQRGCSGEDRDCERRGPDPVLGGENRTTYPRHRGGEVVVRQLDGRRGLEDEQVAVDDSGPVEVERGVEEPAVRVSHGQPRAERPLRQAAGPGQRRGQLGHRESSRHGQVGAPAGGEDAHPDPGGEGLDTAHIVSFIWSTSPTLTEPGERRIRLSTGSAQPVDSRFGIRRNRPTVEHRS